MDGLQQPLSQGVVGRVQCLILLSEVVQFFVLRHGATVADWSVSLQRHSPSEQLLIIDGSLFLYTALERSHA